jgi:hypothetical protein
MNQAHETEHLMRLDKVYPSGAEEWCCIYCERRVLKQREPLEQEIVLNAGVTSNGAVQMVKDTEISEELWLALEEVLSQINTNW